MKLICHLFTPRCSPKFQCCCGSHPTIFYCTSDDSPCNSSTPGPVPETRSFPQRQLELCRLYFVCHRRQLLQYTPGAAWRKTGGRTLRRSATTWGTPRNPPSNLPKAVAAAKLINIILHLLELTFSVTSLLYNTLKLGGRFFWNMCTSQLSSWVLS